MAAAAWDVWVLMGDRSGGRHAATPSRERGSSELMVMVMVMVMARMSNCRYRYDITQIISC
jgi:hypothetical protein